MPGEMADPGVLAGADDVLDPGGEPVGGVGVAPGRAIPVFRRDAAAPRE